MKKLLALILAAALTLSLVACGGDSGAGETNTPSGGNGDATSTDTSSGGGEDNETEEPAMTKEEMLVQAVAISDIDEFKEIIDATKESSGYPYYKSGYELEIYSIHELYKQNPITFKKTYLDKPYYITGYIKSISEKYINLNIHEDGGVNSDMNMTVYIANTDELLDVKTGDLVTIIGILESDENVTLCINNAYII